MTDPEGIEPAGTDATGDPHGSGVTPPGAPEPGAASDPRPDPNPEMDADLAESRSQFEDFEGPRRRARREREQRRAAAARARAIEQARREAKRRLLAGQAEQTAGLDRRAARALKALMWAAVVSVVAVAVGLLLYFTPIMSARAVIVTGLGELTEQEVIEVAAIPPGAPLLQVDTDEVAGRVAQIRRVASVRVQREYPSSVRITVVERVPVVVKDYPDGPHLFDRDGVDFATAPPPPGLPYLDTDNPGPSDPATQAALQVMTALRPEVVEQVSRIAAPSVASITLTLNDGRVVVWGTNDRTEEKAMKLAALLTQPGQTYDVSSPDLPTVK